jgi:uncharacterized membrane protein
MKKKRHLFFSAAIVTASLLLFCLQPVSARENVTDWYVQNFASEILVNKDSMLDITEKITADCGQAIGKHGIFRILPEDVKIGGKTIATPVELINITDFSGQPLKYAETRNRSDDTVTWKIGDPDRTVQGVNHYLIRYRVKNAIRFNDPKFDELYWNLSGNFWDLEIDQFKGTIIFPSEISQGNSTVDYYTGSLGAKGQYLAFYHWIAPNVLEFNSTGTFGLRQGITVSVTFPKNIFIPYQPTLWETYNRYLALLLPLIAFFACFWLWWKYGKDPRVDKTVIAEYDVPGNLSPIELGMLMTNGKFNNELITAEIINLATRGLIQIKELNEKILFFNSKDYELTKIENKEANEALNVPQRAISNRIFAGGGTVKLSSLKDNFYKELKYIKSSTKDILVSKKLIVPSGNVFKTAFLVIGSIFLVSIFLFDFLGGVFIAGAILSSLIFYFFSLIMPKRTPAGAELNWQIKGFKLFMETVDKDRAKFYEEHNIFEKFLPYAIVFGITKIWIQKMKEIYGEDYYTHYAPAWYAGNAAAFDADSFSTAISNLSADIASNTSAPSGSGGGGGAGGGGGGGGGGGW